MVQNDMRGCFKHFLEDAFRQHFWRHGVDLVLLLSVVRIGILHGKVVSSEHVILQVHRHESGIEDGFELFGHILAVLAGSFFLAVLIRALVGAGGVWSLSLS